MPSKKSYRRTREALPQETPPQVQLLNQLLAKANISSYDALLIGDGSGTGWDDACGWATTLVYRITRSRRLFFGAANQGSVNFAEMLPYLQAMCWLDVTYGRAHLKQLGTLTVHILTDSQVTAYHGTLAANPAMELPRANTALWAAMRQFARQGYLFHYHWMERNASELNQYADLVASQARAKLLSVVKLGLVCPEAAEAALREIGQLVIRDPDTTVPIPLHGLNPDLQENP